MKTSFRPCFAISGSFAAVVTLLAACGGEVSTSREATTPDSSSSTSATPVTVREPDLAYADVQLVPGIEAWVRQPIDDSVPGKLDAWYDRADASVEVVVQDYGSSGGLYEIGFVPKYWNSAESRKTYDNGWTCGRLNERSSCYRLLTDGYLELNCSDMKCGLGASEFSTVAGRFYEAFSGGTTDGAVATADEVCAGVSADSVARAVAPFLAQGEVTLNLEDSEAGDSYSCFVSLPAGSFGTDAGTVPEISVLRHAYSDDIRMGTSGSCDFGGSSPDAVFATAKSCKPELEATQPDYAYGVRNSPLSGGGGDVTSLNEVVHAVPGRYWWQVSVTYATFNPKYDDALRKVAATLR